MASLKEKKNIHYLSSVWTLKWPGLCGMYPTGAIEKKCGFSQIPFSNLASMLSILHKFEKKLSKFLKRKNKYFF